MNSNPLKVMIVGAGTGGLCLAQGLNSEGIPVEILSVNIPRPIGRRGTGSVSALRGIAH